jgi:hypothetical protein
MKTLETISLATLATIHGGQSPQPNAPVAEEPMDHQLKRLGQKGCAQMRNLAGTFGNLSVNSAANKVADLCFSEVTRISDERD